MTSRRMLITGAGGFVGGCLARGFADLGWSVTGLDRDVDETGRDRRIDRVVADLTDGVPDEVPHADVVIHAAWVTTPPETLGVTTPAYVALNLRPLLTMLEHVGATRPAVFVFLSSSGVFAPDDGSITDGVGRRGSSGSGSTDGPAEPGRGLTDNDVPTGRSPYAVAKRAAEALVEGAIGGPTEPHVVRLGYLFGPTETSRPSRVGLSLVGRWLAAARAGDPCEVRDDDPTREWTYAPDLAAAFERLVGAPASPRPIHLGSPHIRTDREMASRIAERVSGATVRAVPAPADAPVKPPMIASDIPALRGFAWTSPEAALADMCATEGAA